MESTQKEGVQEYAYKITTHGRNVMAACMAREKPLKITRIAFGSGKVDRDVNLADVHELLEYVSDGAVNERRHEDDRFYLTIQYANMAHPDVKMFFLSEFIVYTTDPDTGEETDLIYGTLGDYRQPVPAYNPAYPPSEFYFPLELIISDEVNIEVPAPAGIVTYTELIRIMNRCATRIVRTDIVIPANGWTEGDAYGPYTIHVDIANADIAEDMTPALTPYPQSLEVVANCELCFACQTLPGALRVYAKQPPTAPVNASLELLSVASSITGNITEEGDVACALPVASAAQLGVVKIGKGLSGAPDGTVSVNPDKVMTDEDLANEDEVAKSVGNILNGDGTK